MPYSSLLFNEEVLNNTDNKQEEPLIMAEPINEEDMLCTQMSQVLGGEDTNILKMTAMADAQKEHGPENNGDELKHQGRKRTNRIVSSRTNKRLKEPKLPSRNKAMDKQVSEEDGAWLSSRTEAQLDLLISIKKMAMERAKTIQDKHVNGIFNFKLLRTIGVLLEEFVKESLKNALSPGDIVETPTVPSDKDEERISLEKDRDCNHIEPIVKVGLEEEMTTTAVTKKKRKHIKPIVKVELEEKTATDVTKRKRNDNVGKMLSRTVDASFVPLQHLGSNPLLDKVGLEEMTTTTVTKKKRKHIKPIVKVELEEKTATDVTKGKRNSSCEGGDVHIKKRNKKRHHTIKAEV